MAVLFNNSPPRHMLLVKHLLASAGIKFMIFHWLPDCFLNLWATQLPHDSEMMLGILNWPRKIFLPPDIMTGRPLKRRGCQASPHPSLPALTSDVPSQPFMGEHFTFMRLLTHGKDVKKVLRPVWCKLWGKTRMEKALTEVRGRRVL